MKNYPDKGKIVDVYMLLKTEYGHAGNVYGYRYASSNQGLME